MISKPIFRQQDRNQILLLVFAWLLGNIWTYQWFIASLINNYLNLILLTVGCLILLGRLIQTDWLNPASFELRWRIQPLFLMLGGEIAAIIFKWSLNIPQLTLLCFILGSYGLIGLLIDNSNWQKGLSLATIAACVLPFLAAFHSGLGFPVRVITAHAVAQTLAEFKLGAVSSHDIILMENGIAQVDLPCSGMKSLWTGTVFLLGATWLEKRQIGWRWLLVAIANLGFLIVANIGRVLILVFTIEVLQQQQVADILHLPLGVVGFMLASCFSWTLLQQVPRSSADVAIEAINQEINASKSDRLNNNWIIVAVIVLGIIGQLQPLRNDQVALTAINLPPSIQTESLELTAAESNFFDNPDNPLVQKLRFKSGELTGSMLLVASDTWQSHHPPELCFMGNGFKVDSMNSTLINDSIKARWLSLQNGDLSAAYWFQSQKSTTDDFVARIWDHLAQRHKTWVMVSVLFNEAETPDSMAIKDFSNTIYQTIDHQYFNS